MRLPVSPPLHGAFLHPHRLERTGIRVNYQMIHFLGVTIQFYLAEGHCDSNWLLWLSTIFTIPTNSRSTCMDTYCCYINDGLDIIKKRYMTKLVSIDAKIRWGEPFGVWALPVQWPAHNAWNSPFLFWSAHWAARISVYAMLQFEQVWWRETWPAWRSSGLRRQSHLTRSGTKWIIQFHYTDYTQMTKLTCGCRWVEPVEL